MNSSSAGDPGIRLEIHPGDAAWKQVAPLFDAVWPPEVRATFPWAHVVWANAMERVLVWNDADELVCHVGVHTRVAKWDGQTIKIGGVGGVITRQDARGRGYASAAMRAAISEMREKGGSDFALLVCEVHNFAFYRVSVGVNSRATCSWNSPKAASGSTS